MSHYHAVNLEEDDRHHRKSHSATALAPAGKEELLTESLSDGKWRPISSLDTNFSPSLEGLRGIAVALTLFCHIIEKPFVLREVSGTIGVSIFFVLSGFLITGVLIRLENAHSKSESHSEKRRVSYRHLPRFYADRFVRLLPATIFMIVSMNYLYAVFRPEMMTSKGTVKKYSRLALFYLQNIPSLWPNKSDPGPFGHLWSLACEEQYYIIWSLALPFIIRMNTRLRFLVAFVLVATSYYFRVYTSMFGTTYGMNWKFSLGTNFYKMVLGSSLRFIPIPGWLFHKSTAYVGLLGIMGTVGALMGPAPFDYQSPRYGTGWNDIVAATATWADPLAAISAILVIIGINGKGKGLWILEGRGTRFVGKVSYAWYLWQTSLLVFSGWQRGYRAMADTGLAFFFAMISTFLIEEPIGQRYKIVKKRYFGS